MGVFKNDVGRPSNKTIIVRNALKGIAVVVIGAGLVAGGYFLNDYQKTVNTDKKDNNINTDKNKGETTTNVNVNNKYENLNFVDTTKISDTYLPILDHPSGEIEVKNGEIILTKLDDNKNKIKEYKTTGITSKVKFITYFNVCYWDFPIGPIAALTEDNELYIAQPSANKSTTELEFKLFEKNITNMLIVTGVHPDQNELYLLTSKNELRRVKSTYKNEGPVYNLSNELYEERILYVGNYHEGGISHQMVIKAKNNNISFFENFTEDQFEPIKYNGENIVVKNILIHEYETSSVYIVTDDNDLLTTIKDRTSSSTQKNCKDCYEFKKYNNLKVKDVKYNYEGNGIKSATIIFSDNSTLKIGDYPHIYNAEQ